MVKRARMKREAKTRESEKLFKDNFGHILRGIDNLKEERVRRDTIRSKKQDTYKKKRLLKQNDKASQDKMKCETEGKLEKEA